MARPTDDPIAWATDTNWSSGSRAGSALKTAVTVGQAAQGFVAGLKLWAGYLNSVLNNQYDWIRYFRDERGTDRYGDGADGNTVVAASGTLTLTEDLYSADVTLGDNCTVETAGYRWFASGTVTVGDGVVIDNSGDRGDDGTGGAGTGAGGAAGSLGGSGSADGAAPQAGAAAGTQGTSLASRSCIQLGGLGGAGGADGQGNAGGAQRDVAPAARASRYRHAPDCFALRESDFSDTTAYAGGGQGGSSGGNESIGGGQQSGGGGGGGGVMGIYWRRAVLSSSCEFRVDGGRGGDGFTTANGSGGGGGGGGGFGVFVCGDLTDNGATFSAAGGAGGDGDGTGANGSAGGAGTWVILVG